MTTLSPSPFPETGIREFSTKEILQRIKAIACTLPPDNMPRCSGQVFVGRFFDGTGNNREADFIKPPQPERTQEAQKQSHFRYCAPGAAMYRGVKNVGMPRQAFEQPEKCKELA